MGLYKKEVLVRPNSSADFETAMNFAKDWLMNTFQEKDENKDSDGNYIDYFFADVFFAPGHANGGQTWRIYTPPCEQKYSMTPNADTGRIEYKVTDLATVMDAIQNNTNSLNEVIDELADHESRIVALESDSDEVEATVI